jgi:hypothetical protein
MAGLARRDEVRQLVFGAAVLHGYAVVDLVGDAEAAGVFQFAERVERQLVLAGDGPAFACVEAVALDALGASDP